MPFDAPLGRTREIVEICRAVWARQAPLVHEGTYYQMPLPAGRGTGLGKALKIIAHPVRPQIPVWLAALGEKNVAMTAEIAEGWIPMLFIPEKAKEVWGASLDAGLARRSPERGPLQITVGGLLAIGEGEEVTRLRDLGRPTLALYVGGMGAKGRNFYNDVVRRYGFEEEAAAIQDLYLDGHKTEAEARVPEELLEASSLCGPPSYVAERIAAFAEAGVTHLQVIPVPVGDQRTVDLIAKVKELAVWFPSTAFRGSHGGDPVPARLLGRRSRPSVGESAIGSRRVERQQGVELGCHLLDLLRLVVPAAQSAGQLILDQLECVLGGGRRVVDGEQAGLHGLGRDEPRAAPFRLGRQRAERIPWAHLHLLWRRALGVLLFLTLLAAGHGDHSLLSTHCSVDSQIQQLKAPTSSDGRANGYQARRRGRKRPRKPLHLR